MNTEVSALLWKEMRQIPRKRSATLTAVLLPLLFFVVMPVANIYGARSGLTNGPVGLNVPTFGNVSGDPAEMLRDFMLPLIVTLGGLVIQTITATHTIIGERERRTLELLVVLPVSLEHIITSKLVAVLLLGAAVAVPLFMIDAVVFIALGIASIEDVLALLFLLIAALLYSTASALPISLLAADFRTANNLNGALIGPIILLTTGAIAVLPGGTLRPLILGIGFLVIAAILTIVALRALTIERFLR